jgi:hypothetical protein
VCIHQLDLNGCYPEQTFVGYGYSLWTRLLHWTVTDMPDAMFGLHGLCLLGSTSRWQRLMVNSTWRFKVDNEK